MSGRRAILATVALSLAALFALLGGGALAFFSNGGSGSAEVGVSQIGAPTITGATTAPSTVSLAWTEVSAPGEGTVRYYVTRDGGEPAGNCSGQTNPAANLSCTDSEVPEGEHVYEVTAVWKSWSATSEPKSVTSTVGAATQFRILASNAKPVAGEPVDLTISARDAGGGVVTSYAGNKTLVFSGAEASPDGTKPTVVNRSNSVILFGSNTSLTFTAGIATVSSNRNGVLRIYRSGPTEVKATQGSITTPTPLVLTVEPEVAAELKLAASTTTPVAGAADDLTVTALDEYGNVASGYSGSKGVVFSGAEASPDGNVATVTDSGGEAVELGAPTPLQFTEGVAAATGGSNGALVVYDAGAANVKATEGSLTTPTALALSVSPGAASKLALTASLTTVVATSTTNLTTTAQDAYGNTATTYSGNKNIYFSGASASPSGTVPTVVNRSGTSVNFAKATSLAFTSGVAAVSSGRNGLTRLRRAEPTEVSATDGTISTATPLAVTVLAGTASRVAFESLTATAGTIGSPCLFTCPVSGLGNKGQINARLALTDSLGNVVSNVGSTKTATVSVTAGGTIAGSPLSIPSTGAAITSASFTYTAPSSGSFSHTITAASSGYTSATSAVTK